MSKQLLQDMVRVKHDKRDKREVNIEPKEIYSEPIGLIKKPRKKTRYGLWVVAVLVLVFLLYSISYLFSKAVVTINPKMQELILNENLSASQGGNGSVVPFELVVISGEENRIIKTVEEKDIAQKAIGSVIIYNTFSSAIQLLSIDTRLEGSNGKIYKTQTKTTIPGMSKDGKPGSVEVKIYGAEVGAEYNSAPLDFKIFGFKGTPKYAKFYARSKGEIAGGFKGKSPVIPESERASVMSEMKTALQSKLLQKATDQIPGGFILFKDAVVLNTDDNASIDLTAVQNQAVPIKLKGTLYGLLFNEQKLTKKIAQNNIEKYDGSEVFMPNIRDLKFILPNKEQISSGEIKNINFNLSGTTKIVWKLDVDQLTADLLGKSKKDFKQILSQYPNIESGDLVVSPFWKNAIPDVTKNIEVIVNNSN